LAFTPLGRRREERGGGRGGVVVVVVVVVEEEGLGPLLLSPIERGVGNFHHLIYIYIANPTPHTLTL